MATVYRKYKKGYRTACAIWFKLKKWKAELNHVAYLQKVNKEAGFTVISYHQFETDDEDVNGEESLKDVSDNIEDMVIDKMETKRLIELVGKLSKEDQEMIYCFYLTEAPMKETIYAKKWGFQQVLLMIEKHVQSQD